ncbi:MAG: MarC family protein [Armatimonadetes bacterium]|nr:MarC family protein [Armatimonadota bacterium]
MNAAIADFGIVAFSSLLGMLNPVGAAPVFLAMTHGMARDRHRVAVRASIAALIALILFAAAGAAVFRFFGVTVPAFQIVGGLLFLTSGLKNLNGVITDSEAEVVTGDPSVVPLGIPVVAGAGSLSTVMVLSGQARTQIDQAVLAGAIVLAMVATLLVLLAAPFLINRLGNKGQEIIIRLTGLLTAVIGVQFIINGGTTVLKDLLRAIQAG